MLLPWGETSVLGHLIAQWRRLAAAQIAVVCATDDQTMQTELQRLAFPAKDCIYNPAPERGMFSSVQCAGRWTEWEPDLTHWAIALGDQPHLRDETLRAILELAAAHPASVCQPERGGHHRHPVVLPRSVFAELAGSHTWSLKEFLTRYEVAICRPDDAGLELDIDWPEDYQKAAEMLRSRTNIGH